MRPYAHPASVKIFPSDQQGSKDTGFFGEQSQRERGDKAFGTKRKTLKRAILLLLLTTTTTNRSLSWRNRTFSCLARLGAGKR